MNKRLLAILALTLCVGALLFPVTAYAASDTTPPIVNAWISGDNLHVEASDNDGVETAYINGARVNYRVDGAFDVPLKDYAGSGEYITVYAVDFAGNKSNEVKIKNPYYTAPTATPKPTAPPAAQKPATPAPATPSPTPESTPAPTESAVPAEPQPFTPDGTGTVVDNVVEQNAGTSGASKEFFTITTEDENIFYLIIDRQRDSENVYLLNAVTEDDLLGLAEKSDGTTQSAVPTPEPTPQQTEPTPEPTPEPEPEQPVSGGMNTGAILLIVVAALGVGGAGYYFKILKPKQEAASGEDEDDFDDEDEYGDGPDYPDDSEDDYSGYDDRDDSGSVTEEE